MRKHKKSANESKRNHTLKIVLLTTVTVLILAGAGSFYMSDLITPGEQPEPDSISETGSDPTTHGEPALQLTPDPEPDAEPEPFYTPEPDTVNVAEPEPTPDPPPPPADRITVTDLVMIDPVLAGELDAESSKHNSAAVSLVIYDGYAGMFYTYSYGYADKSTGRKVNADTKFRVASLSKLVVVICAMKLVESNILDLDEDISVYLGYKVRNSSYPDIPITSRMLMQHTSSIYDSNAFMDSNAGRVRASTQSILSRSSSYRDTYPGEVHEYTNFGYAVLGAVAEHASGKILDDFAREILFDPLDIDASFLAANLKDKGNIATLYNTHHAVARSVATQLNRTRTSALGQNQSLNQGSLVISAFDYAKILAMLGNGGVFLNERILTQGSVVEIHKADVEGPGYKQGLSTRFTAGGSTDETDDFLIWRYIRKNGEQVPGDGFYWHTGSAHGVFAQKIYVSGTGTSNGVGDVNSGRGVVVVTTGARDDQAPIGLIEACTPFLYSEIGIGVR